MNILITGATGLIGQSLGLKLVAEGHKITVLSRNKLKAQSQVPFPCEVIEHDLVQAPLPAAAFRQIEAIVHLLGETIDGRWTEEKKKEILQSRKASSENLLLNCPESVKTIVSASAQGFYGETDDTAVDETSPKGFGFLAEVCEQWESVFQNLISLKKKRVVIVRLGVVLSRRGGALKKLINLFQKNLGAVLSDGRQWMSWISLKDATDVFYSALTQPSWNGVVNAVTPKAVTNQEFTEKLAKALNCFTGPAIPGVVLKVALGEMSQLVLGSTKVKPSVLIKNNFKYTDSDLAQFFSQELVDFRDGQGLFEAEQFLPYPIEKVYSFFADAQNLERITPETLNFNIKNMSTAAIQKGTLIDYRLKIHGVPASWQTLIEVWNPPYEFVDTQLKGPYKKWHHTHQFRSFAGGTLMTDFIRFQLPMGGLGRMVAGSFVESDIKKIFDYRRKVIADQKF